MTEQVSLSFEEAVQSVDRELYHALYNAVLTESKTRDIKKYVVKLTLAAFLAEEISEAKDICTNAENLGKFIHEYAHSYANFIAQITPATGSLN
jgi:hypothetical protein